MPPHVVSLGSSFAAGPGIPPQTNTAARRSANNYPSLLAQSLNAKHTDLTVSGATLLTLLSESQETVSGVIFEPQINLLPADADIVTITAGGNDINYVGGIWTDEAQFTYLGRLSLWWSGLTLQEKVPSEDELVDRFAAVLDAVSAKAPKAHILLVEYTTLMGDDIKSGVHVYMSEERIRHHQQVAGMLQRATVRAAGGRPQVEVAHVAKASQSHAVGSVEPWVNGSGLRLLLQWKAPWHPNLEGMRAVAKMIEESLRKRGIVR